MSVSKKIFMIKKLWWDIRRGDDFYQIAQDLTSSELREYYFIFREDRVNAGKDQALIKNFDENGIPLSSTYIDIAEKKLFYFPISIGQLGLAVYHTYLASQNQADLDRFIKFANWFIENADISEQLGVRWLTQVSLPAYRNPGPWQSAFAQSRGISILLRAFQNTKEKKFAEYAESALESFRFSPKEGGVTSITEWGPFFEEYTANVPTLVLNGHIFSWFGLHDYYRCFPDNDLAAELVETGYQTLINCLPDFDMGFWSRYNYCEADFYPEIDPATLQYQRLHVLLLKVVNRIRQNEVLDKYIVRWKEQGNILNFIKSSALKYKAVKDLNRL